MNHYLYKLIPPRPTFGDDVTEAESTAMRQHVEYWQGLLHKGIAVVFGPVADPGGVWGLAVVQADDEQDVHALGADDPAVKSHVATYEVCGMPGAFSRP